MALRRVRVTAPDPNNPDEVIVDDGRTAGVNSTHMAAAAGGSSLTVILPIVLGWLFTWPISTPNADQVNAIAGLLVIVGAAVWAYFVPSPQQPLIIPTPQSRRLPPSFGADPQVDREGRPPPRAATGHVALPREIVTRLIAEIELVTRGHRIVTAVWETLYWTLRRALQQIPVADNAVAAIFIAPLIQFNEKGPEVMYQLKSTNVGYFPIVSQDAAGDVVPAPQGDTFTVTSSDPTKAAVTLDQLPEDVGPYKAGSPAVKVVPLTRNAPGMSFTVTDSAGLSATPVQFEIVDDLTPQTLGADTANVVTQQQAEPPA